MSPSGRANLFLAKSIMGVHSNGDPHKEISNKKFENNVIDAMEAIKSETGSYPQIHDSYPSFNTFLNAFSEGSSSDLFIKNMEHYNDWGFSRVLNMERAYSKTEHDLSGQVARNVEWAMQFLFIARIFASRGVEVKSRDRGAFLAMLDMTAHDAEKYIVAQSYLSNAYIDLIIAEKWGDVHDLRNYVKTNLDVTQRTVVKAYSQMVDHGIKFTGVGQFISLRFMLNSRSKFYIDHAEALANGVEEFLVQSGLNINQLTAFIDEGFFDLDYIKSWVDNGFWQASEASKWYSMGYQHPDEAKSLAGKTPNSWIRSW